MIIVDHVFHGAQDVILFMLIPLFLLILSYKNMKWGPWNMFHKRNEEVP